MKTKQKRHRRKEKERPYGYHTTRFSKTKAPL